MNRIAEDILMHIGVPRRSGRYRYGSGDNPYQRTGDFISRVQELKKQGNLTEIEIAKAVGLKTTGDLRKKYSNTVNEQKERIKESARAMEKDGKSRAEIRSLLGLKETTLRDYLKEQPNPEMKRARNVADFLKSEVDEKGMIDVGIGVEREIRISRGKLDNALTILQEEGYPVYSGRVPQATNPGRRTTITVACPPGTEHKDIFAFQDGVHNINTITDYKIKVGKDGEDVPVKGFQYPESMDSKRLGIRYSEDGGIKKDGVIELRRGVDDISLGESRYAQVRILVDGTHYLKGMAMYSDNMPEGVDVVFNTNKPKGTPPEKVLKPIKPNDPENPFGSLIKENGGQSTWVDKDGKEHLSLINKRADEGDWGEWTDALPSQFLAKQPIKLIKQQLKLAADNKQAELDDILAVNNVTVKRELLQSYADDCDSAAEHLKAAALPRQKYQVILPFNSIKDNEIYATNFEDGEVVTLVRFPHGGTFEIPELIVNNKNEEAKRALGATSKDAVGINSKVAARLSGADFDGDTVLVIPSNSDRSKVRIKTQPTLDGLKDFDPGQKYGYDDSKTDDDGNTKYFREGKEIKIMRATQLEMGKISNLITDMTLKGAVPDELAKAVRHSMVVIDAEKHKLDYKKSEEDNGIKALRLKYMGRMEDEQLTTSASTLLSRAGSEINVPKRTGNGRINQKGKPWYDSSLPEGEKIWWNQKEEEYKVIKKIVDPDTGEIIKIDTGKTKKRTEKSTQMAEVRDANLLSSGTEPEKPYAEYANKMKALANTARKELVYAGRLKYDASANTAYSEEVNSLLSKLNISLKNAPRERQAQIIANSIITAKKQDNPDLKDSELKKLSQNELTKARIKVGASRIKIPISDKEWQAIQAGAVSDDRLTKIIRNADIDEVRKLATPRSYSTLNPAKINRAKKLESAGYTTAEIAKAMNVPRSTIDSYLSDKGGN